MTELNQIYKCVICDNIIEVVHDGAGDLVCCGAPMELKEENIEDAAQEKHVPVMEAVGNKVMIKVGSVEHPMEKAHYIEWIEIITSVRIYRKYLKPELDKKAEAEFTIEGEVITARAYCNVHGLWKSK